MADIILFIVERVLRKGLQKHKTHTPDGSEIGKLVTVNYCFRHSRDNQRLTGYVRLDGKLYQASVPEGPVPLSNQQLLVECMLGSELLCRRSAESFNTNDMFVR